MTVQRISAGIPAGGQFAASARGEAALALSDEAPAVLDEATQVRAVMEEAELLISREVADGGYFASAREDDVADAIREKVPHLGDEQFDEHMAKIAHAAEAVSIVEHTDETDTEAYAPFALEAGIDVSDFPSDYRWEDDEEPNDLDAFRGAVMAHYDAQVRTAATAMVQADAAAAERLRTLLSFLS